MHEDEPGEGPDPRSADPALPDAPRLPARPALVEFVDVPRRSDDVPQLVRSVAAPSRGAGLTPFGLDPSASTLAWQDYEEPELVESWKFAAALLALRIVAFGWAAWLVLGARSMQTDGITQDGLDDIVTRGQIGFGVTVLVAVVSSTLMMLRTINVHRLDGRLPSRTRCVLAWLAPLLVVALASLLILYAPATEPADIRPLVAVVAFLLAMWRPYSLVRRILASLTPATSNPLLGVSFVLDIAGFGVLWWQLLAWSAADEVTQGRVDVLVAIGSVNALSILAGVAAWFLILMAMRRAQRYRRRALRTRHTHRMLRLQGIDPLDADVWWAMVHGRLGQVATPTADDGSGSAPSRPSEPDVWSPTVVPPDEVVDVRADVAARAPTESSTEPPSELIRVARADTPVEVEPEDRIDERVERIDERVERIDERVEQIGERIERIDRTDDSDDEHDDDEYDEYDDADVVEAELDDGSDDGGPNEGDEDVEAAFDDDDVEFDDGGFDDGDDVEAEYEEDDLDDDLDDDEIDDVEAAFDDDDVEFDDDDVEFDDDEDAEAEYEYDDGEYDDVSDDEDEYDDDEDDDVSDDEDEYDDDDDDEPARVPLSARLSEVLDTGIDVDEEDERLLEDDEFVVDGDEWWDEDDELDQDQTDVETDDEPIRSYLIPQQLIALDVARLLIVAGYGAATIAVLWMLDQTLRAHVNGEFGLRADRIETTRLAMLIGFAAANAVTPLWVAVLGRHLRLARIDDIGVRRWFVATAVGVICVGVLATVGSDASEIAVIGLIELPAAVGALSAAMVIRLERSMRVRITSQLVWAITAPVVFVIIVSGRLARPLAAGDSLVQVLFFGALLALAWLLLLVIVALSTRDFHDELRRLAGGRRRRRLSRR